MRALQFIGKNTGLFGPCFLLLSLLLQANLVEAQFSCPPNIDFEQGNTGNWLFYTGTCCPISTPTLSGPVTNRHVLTSGTGLDLYGSFPTVAPGGGSYSLKLGNSSTGAQAERARYYVHVPTGASNYSLIYRYAVVFENPGHQAADQPRFEVKAFDSANGLSVPCAQFNYVSSSSLPGFVLSPYGYQVYYKGWSTASIDLSGQGGKTIAVDFASGDCGLSGHFGYGYLDLNCSLFQIVSVNCNNSPTTTLTAPPGFQTYQWYNASYTQVGTGQTISIATPATTSQYHVVLTPFTGYGCPDTLTTTVSVSSLSVNATNDTFVCSGNPIQLSAGASGTSTIFNYSWTPAAGLSCTNCANPVATSATNRTYYVTVTDGNGCAKTDSVKLTVGPFATATSQNVSCFGGNNGSATLVPAQGKTPYSYSWSTIPAQTTVTAASLSAGSYNGIVTDANGCKDTVTVNITQPSQLYAFITNSNVPCFGGATASASVAVIGGTTPYTYQWNTTPVQSSSSISNLSAGMYIATVTDSKGCIAKDTATVSEPVLLAAQISASTHVSCNGGSNGAATVSAGGGTAPYAYSWNTSPLQTTATASGLSAGNYIVTVTDSNGCTDTAMVTIGQPAALSATVSSTPVLCFGAATGAATVTASGGMAPYSFAWNTSPAQTTATASGLTAGNYSVSVTDSNGCTTSASVSITQPSSAVSVSVLSSVGVLCFGGANGAATAGATGGTPPYSYSWNTTPLQAIANVGNLSQGNYIVTATDNNGCIDTAQVSILQPDSLSLTLSAGNVSCNGGTNGTASVLAAGGTAPYSYLWLTTPPQSAAAINNLSAGSYGVTVTDGHGCAKTDSISIIQPASLTVNAGTLNNVSCNGGSNGTATVIATGGTLPYSYSWNTSPVQNTSAAANLPAGNYVVTVVDGNACAKSDTVIITQPLALVATTSNSSVNCFNGNNATATVAVTGGTLPYTYSWNTSPVQTGVTAVGLAAGNYSVSIIDSAGCTTSASTVITQPTQLVASVSSLTPVSCFGGADGAASVSVAGGVAPYTYSWAGLPAQTTAVATGLSAGSYLVTVTDGNGCTDTALCTISQPPALSLSMSATAVPCFGGASGTASVAANGGTAPYTYLWSNAQTSAAITNLSAGTYFITATDSKGCTRSDSVVVTQPAAALASSLTKTNVPCFGGNGTATVTATGGTAPYTYSWNTTPVQTTATATNLAGGTYVVTITDANGCMWHDTAVITQPANPVTVTAGVVSQVSCNGGSNGSASALASGGVAPYTYSWNTTPAQSSANATNLPAGTYTVTVTDANNCSNTGTVTLTQPSALSASAATVSVSCYGGNNGSATVAAAGGTSPYTYSWNTTPVQTGISASGLSAGTYSIVVTDSKGCTTSASATVTQPAQLNASISARSDVTCIGLTNGTATVSATGGTAPYTYQWTTTPVQTNISATGLAPGSYSVVVADSKGCLDTALAIIAPAAPILTSFTGVTHVRCFGGNDGAATVSASGGKAPYTYSWNTSPIQTTGQATSLTAGMHIVTVTDSNGCSKTDTVYLQQPSDIVLNTQVVATCEGLNNGLAAASVSGGTPPYKLLWSNSQTTDTIRNLLAGNYSITVTDSSNCTQTASVAIPNYPSPAVDAGADARLCAGASLQLHATGAAAYSWSPATWLSCTQCSDPFVTAPADITYTVVGSNGFSCSDTDEVKITVVQRKPVSVGGRQQICEGEAVTLSAGGGISYRWTPATLLSNSQVSNPTAYPGASTVFTVVITENECFRDTLTQEVVVHPLPVVDLGPDRVVVAGTVITLQAAASGATGIAWSPAAGLSCDNCFDPVATLTESITYTVTVSNALGCKASDDLYIKVTCDNSAIFMPNTFTPNGDGNNDVYFPVGKGVSVVKRFTIFNRWGQKVFEAADFPANDPNYGWDGTFKGEKLSTDVFVYLLEAVCTTGDPIVLKGDIALLR